MGKSHKARKEGIRRAIEHKRIIKQQQMGKRKNQGWALRSGGRAITPAL